MNQHMGSFMLALQHRPALIRGALAVLVPMACPRGLLIPRDRIPMPYARCPLLSYEASCAIDIPLGGAYNVDLALARGPCGLVALACPPVSSGLPCGADM